MQTITVNKKRLEVKEYNGQRVVTFADIDAVHGRPEGTARRNFNVNRLHFLIGVDYFVRKTSEAAKEFGTIAPNGLTLITESGYLMLVKSFTDDLAWQVQRELVNSYFKAKEPPYEYFDKTYNGEAVITLLDFAYFTGKTKDAVSYYMRNGSLVSGKDFYLINNVELRKFKSENPSCNKWFNSLYLITKSGFTKLCKYFGIKIKTPECFNLSTKVNSEISKTPPAPSFLHGEKLVVDTPVNVKIQKAMQELKQKCDALKVVLDLADMYLSEDEYDKHMFTLEQIGFAISHDTCVLKRMKPNLINKYI